MIVLHPITPARDASADCAAGPGEALPLKFFEQRRGVAASLLPPPTQVRHKRINPAVKMAIGTLGKAPGLDETAGRAAAHSQVAGDGTQRNPLSVQRDDPLVQQPRLTHNQAPPHRVVDTVASRTPFRRSHPGLAIRDADNSTPQPSPRVRENR